MRIYGGSLALSWHSRCSVEAGGGKTHQRFADGRNPGCWIPPHCCLQDRQEGWVLAVFYQPSFHGGGALLLQNHLPGTLMKAAMVHSDRSRAFSLILSLLHHIICCLALAAHFSLISLQLGTIGPPPTPHPHSSQPQTSR